MDIEAAVVSKLQTITALGGRIYPAEALKNAQAPFVFWVADSETEEQALDGYKGLISSTVEVHVVGATYAEMAARGADVRAALIAMQGATFTETGWALDVQRADVSRSGPDLHETEVGMFRRVYSAAFIWRLRSVPVPPSGEAEDEADGAAEGGTDAEADAEADGDGDGTAEDLTDGAEASDDGTEGQDE